MPNYRLRYYPHRMLTMATRNENEEEKNYTTPTLWIICYWCCWRCWWWRRWRYFRVGVSRGASHSEHAYNGDIPVLIVARNSIGIVFAEQTLSNNFHRACSILNSRRSQETLEIWEKCIFQIPQKKNILRSMEKIGKFLCPINIVWNGINRWSKWGEEKYSTGLLICLLLLFDGIQGNFFQRENVSLTHQIFI